MNNQKQNQNKHQMICVYCGDKIIKWYVQLYYSSGFCRIVKTDLQTGHICRSCLQNTNTSICSIDTCTNIINCDEYIKHWRKIVYDKSSDCAETDVLWNKIIQTNCINKCMTCIKKCVSCECALCVFDK